jgi:hypothetical protein
MTFRYRRLDARLDMNFGRGALDFIVDTAEAVAQSVYTRLCLWEGEWWLNTTEGTPWLQEVLGHAPSGAADAAIRARIAGTPYLTRIYDYASFFDPTARTFTISCKIDTAFGQVTQAPPGMSISPSGALVFSVSVDAMLEEPHELSPPPRQLPQR